MTQRDLHVVPWGGAWAINADGSAVEPFATYPTEQEAIEAGRKEARSRACELKIHALDGTIRDSDSYGDDPPSN